MWKALSPSEMCLLEAEMAMGMAAEAVLVVVGCSRQVVQEAMAEEAPEMAAG
jgi:hypothetical protein